MPQTPAADDLPPLDVLWLSPDGTVGGRTRKGTFKLRGALPGDRIQALQASRRGRTLQVTDWEMVEPSERVDHPCPVIDRCGGCDLGRMDPDARRQALVRMVRQSLRMDRDPDWMAPPNAHRSRITLRLGDEDVGYHAARSHDRVAISGCPIAHPAIDALIPGLLDGGRPEGATSIELRTDGERVVGVLDRGRPTPDQLPELEHLAVGGRVVRGDPTLSLRVAGQTLRASPRSFFQVNAAGNELLVRRIVANIERIGPERVLDLYSGIGNLTLPIAATGVPTVAVELEGQATKDLAFNARRAGHDIAIHTRAVERFDTTQVPFDLVVLDPPRAGCPGIVERLLLQRPRAIQLVSCHVASAARDLKPALAAGYRITDFAVVDLFVPTHHIETMVLLERS